jgi:aminomethyltransferase
MVEFAGYAMPVQYTDGIIAEHRWTRSSAGLFDVSHMGPAFLSLPTLGGGDGAHAEISAVLEPLVCGDIAGLEPGEQRLTLLLNDEGGIIDDLMVTRPAESERQGQLQLVVNAGTKDGDFALIARAIGDRAKLERADDRGLIALQGPKAAEVMAEIAPAATELVFMRATTVKIDGAACPVSRSGYTGEDGFEVLVPADKTESFARRLLADERVKPIGLGARDSLRLEAGMCLNGHDINPTTSPVEATLLFTVSKNRRERADFPGADRVLREIAEKPSRKRVGLKLKGRAPAREGAKIITEAGEGVVTSGGFGPTVEAPIAMGYVPFAASKAGTEVQIEVRGRALDAEVVKTPFAPHNYFRG